MNCCTSYFDRFCCNFLSAWWVVSFTLYNRHLSLKRHCASNTSGSDVCHFIIPNIIRRMCIKNLIDVILPTYSRYCWILRADHVTRITSWLVTFFQCTYASLFLWYSRSYCLSSSLVKKFPIFREMRLVSHLILFRLSALFWLRYCNIYNFACLLWFSSFEHSLSIHLLYWVD
jgi:hypothetical protein